MVIGREVSPHFRELRERQVDFVLARPPRLFAADDLQVEVLLDEALAIAAGTGSAWARRRKIALADLVAEPWVLPPPETVAGVLARQVFEQHGLAAPEAGVLSLSTHLRCCLIGSGHFLGVLPASVIRFNAARFSLKTLPIDLQLEVNPVAIVRLKGRTLGPLVDRFIAVVRETLSTA